MSRPQATGLIMTDRKLLKRQYLETKTRAGVYAIRNRVTGQVLVAGSTNAQGALNRHRFELRQGVHRNGTLSRAWAEHGEACFLFEVLDTVKPSDDPDFDPALELETLVDLWRQEIPGSGDPGYDDPGSRVQ